MIERVKVRLTYANVVSSVALFLVLGGTAFALARNSVGNKQLRKNSVSASKIRKDAVNGKKVKNQSLTGSDIKLSTLGSVPTAKALTIFRSNKLTQTTATDAATFAAAQAAAPQVVLYNDSHFQVYAKCFRDLSAGPEIFGYIYIATKQNGAIFDSDDDELSGSAPNGFLDIATSEDLRQVQDEATATANDANVQFEGDTEFAAVTADKQWRIQGDNGIAVKQGTLAAGDGLYGAGNVCIFTNQTFHPNS